MQVIQKLRRLVDLLQGPEASLGGALDVNAPIGELGSQPSILARPSNSQGEVLVQHDD